MALRIEPHEGGVKISVKVVPGASRDRIVGVLGDALKIAVSKPPAGGAANAAVVELLAETLAVPRNCIRVIRGHANPRKQLAIHGVTAEQVAARIAGLT